MTMFPSITKSLFVERHRTVATINLCNLPSIMSEEVKAYRLSGMVFTLQEVKK
jgi:hypothetical protein